MQNGIGLQTAKGSGTNGYVTRNMGSLKAQRMDWQGLNKSFKSQEVIKIKKANPELLLHEQKRKVEVELMKLRDELETAGMQEEEIEKNLDRERNQMLSAVEDGSLRYDSELEKKDSHALALDKEREMARFEKALGINKGGHVAGAAFDQDLQANMKLERMQQRAEQEKQRLLADIEERRQKRAEEQEAHEHMLQQLKQMEEKMLVGSQVMETAMRQENELRKAEIEVDERKREEQRMKEELEAAAEEKLNLEEKYASTEEQVQKLTAKLEKLWNRHKQTQQETQDLQQEFQLEREDMLETIRDLRKEVKLVCLTIDSFIPMEQYQQIVERAHYDDSTDEWVITNIDLAGNRVRPARKRILDDGHSGDSPRALLRGPDSSQQGDPGSGFAEERPNVYFAYTEDGGAARAETRPAPSPQKTSKNQRMKSAGRPNTANRKGRAVKTGAAGASATSMNNFLHSPDPEEDDGLHAYPKARGLVKAAS
mmetsp:Transcript_71254/g.188039  ORF Transcript_71254/g.188039 Transcript_71254/m.188039 type:complete len:483 (+) Transcript_71254:118-1566(+)